MKALSVRAPWWWAILHGKPVENRDWYSGFRGTFYLHTSKHWSRREIEQDLEDINYMAEQDGLVLPKVNLDYMLDAAGCIVGTLEMVGCVTHHQSAFFVGKYGFVLKNPTMLPQPIPFKGALGFFDVPDTLLESRHP